MKLVLFTTLLINCLALSPSFSAQDGLSQSETRQLVKSLKDETSLSSKKIITELKELLQRESTKSDLNSPLILVLNEAILTKMRHVESHAEIKTIFEKFGSLAKINITNENINLYASMLVTGANAHLNLQEYDDAKNVIVELQSYLSLYELTGLNEAQIFMLAGQLHIVSGEYEVGLAKLRLGMEVIQRNPSFDEVDKRKRLSEALSYIGNTYYTLGDYKNAIKYNYLAIDKGGDFLYSSHLAAYTHNIASSHLELLEWDQALNTATLASQKAKETNRFMYLALSNEVIAPAQHGLGKSVEAIEIIHTSIQTYKENGYTQKVIEALAYESEFHISLGHWDKAQTNLMEAHSIIENSKNQTIPTVELLQSSFLIAEQDGNLAKATFYQKQLSKLEEDDFKVKKELDAQQLMLHFELELAQEKSSRLEKQNELNDIILEKGQNQQRILVTVIFAVIVVLLLLAYVYIRERNLKIKMRLLAMTDHLTGCPNRRNVMEQAKGMLTNNVSKNGSMIIAILDVDNFKSINDTYGHDVGDKVLQNLTSIIIGALRETDVIGRYGGEEFIILLPSAGEKEITMIFDRVQTALKNHNCEYHGESVALPITVSIGAAVVNKVTEKIDHKGQDLLLDTIIKQADEKAYEAKKGGKDQLRLYIASEQH
jgi:diguanylate cyclase (GGDEF)-like protein